MIITAVRHGETVENAAGVIQGQKLGTLSGVGRAQIQQLSATLAKEKFEAVYCSDLQRCKETAAAIMLYHPDLSIVYDERLRERSMQPVEGQTFAEIGWTEQDKFRLDGRTDQGETWLDVRARLVPVINEIISRHEGHILLVTHGGPLRVLDSVLTDQPLEETIWNQYDNCAVRQWEINLPSVA